MMNAHQKRQAVLALTENPVYTPASGLRSVTMEWLEANAPGWVLANLVLLSDLRQTPPTDPKGGAR